MRGLVLSGGKSSRMGSAKAEICYHGEPEFIRCAKLLKSVCSEVYLSTSEFWAPTEFDHDIMRILPDEVGKSNGPLSGLAAAFKKDDNSAWFVLACDLPYFDAEAVEFLLAHRDKDVDATCFIGFQQRPEPLCAIYEARAATAIIDAFAGQKSCPRKVIEGLQTKRVIPLNFNWVRNVNEKAIAIEVRYVAQLREARGCSVETIKTSASTPRAIYKDLAQKHGFMMSPKHMRVAVNDVIVDWDRPVSENDRLMFVPPVAGG